MCRVSSRNFTLRGPQQGGVGGECAPSCAECKRKFYLFLEDSLLDNSPANANIEVGFFFLGEEIL